MRTGKHAHADPGGQLLRRNGTGGRLLHAATRWPFPFDGTRRGFPSAMNARILSAVSRVTLQPARNLRTKCRSFKAVAPNAVALMSFSTMNRSMSASNLSVDLVMAQP